MFYEVSKCYVSIKIDQFCVTHMSVYENMINMSYKAIN